MVIKNVIIDGTEDIYLLNLKFRNITNENGKNIEVIDEQKPNLLNCIYNKIECCSNYDINGMSTDYHDVYCARYYMNYTNISTKFSLESSWDGSTVAVQAGFFEFSIAAIDIQDSALVNLWMPFHAALMKSEFENIIISKSNITNNFFSEGILVGIPGRFNTEPSQVNIQNMIYNDSSMKFIMNNNIQDEENIMNTSIQDEENIINPFIKFSDNRTSWDLITSNFTIQDSIFYSDLFFISIISNAYSTIFDGQGTLLNVFMNNITIQGNGIIQNNANNIVNISNSNFFGPLNIIMKTISNLSIENSYFTNIIPLITNNNITTIKSPVSLRTYLLYIDNSSIVAINNCNFISTFGLNISQFKNLKIMNSNFREHANSALIISNSHFSSLTIIDSSYFCNNVATSDGGAINLNLEQFSHNLQIINSNFTNNTAYSLGGAIFISLNPNQNNQINISNITSINNKARIGGSISLISKIYKTLSLTNIIIANSNFDSDTALFPNNQPLLNYLYLYLNSNLNVESGGLGGCIFLYCSGNCSISIFNNNFQNNKALVAGGTIYTTEASI